MDHRQHPRVPVNPPARARFQLEDQVHHGIPIVNIGMRGCCINTPRPLADLLVDHPVLKVWQLKGPGLPTKSVKARVIWVGQDGGPSGSDFRAGIQFQDSPMGFSSLIFRYVTMRSHTIPRGGRGVDPG